MPEISALSPGVRAGSAFGGFFLIAFPALAAVFLLFLFGMEVRFDRAISGAQGGIAQKMISIVAYIARCNNSA
jgi:hypothetical protein